MKYKRWTKEEDEKLLREYKTKGAKQMQKELEGRTIAAIHSRYSYLTTRAERKQQAKKEKVKECPFCGSKHFNPVITWVGNARTAYYCMNCLREFTPYGDLIPPLYTEEAEG